MNDVLTPLEERADRNGKIGAVVGLILLLILMLIPMFFSITPAPGQPGILVNLGQIDVGQGNENGGPAAPTAPADPVEPIEEVTPPPSEPSVPPPPAPAEPDPAPEQRDVIQQEDPAAIALAKEKARQEARRRAEAAEADRRRQEQLDAEQRVRDAAEAERRRKAEEQRRLDEAERQRQAALAAERQRRENEANQTGNRVGGLFGGGDGNGQTGKPGNQGVENGDPNADRLTGISTGDGRVSGGLGGRGVVASPAVRDNSQKEGRVVIAVCVGPDGNIIEAKYTQQGSSTADPALVDAARRNAQRWAFKPEPTAPSRQCGFITYDFKVQ